jgi:radical SAM-linked protein
MEMSRSESRGAFMKRYRLQYHKTKEIRFTSNLDIHKIWERWLRRAKLPISYSQGFHPQPKINQAAPLPLGMVSCCELVDVWLDEDLAPADVLERLRKTQQPGLPITLITEVPLEETAMQSRIFSSDYLIHFLDEISEPEIQEKVQQTLEKETIIREKRGKNYDLRPLIQTLELIHNPDGKVVLSSKLTMQAGATGRADELVEALEISQESVLIERVLLEFSS